MATPYENNKVMAPLELKIQNWLLQGFSAENISQQFDETHGEWNERDTVVGFQFLYQSGLYKKAAHLFAQRLREKRWIPWGIALRLLNKSFPNFQKEWMLAVAKGVKKQNAQDQTWGYRNHDFELDFWVELRETFKKRLKEQISDYQKRLIEQIEYFQSQRLLDREEKALKKLMTMDPHNPELAKQWQNFRERWAVAVLQKKREHSVPEELEPKDPKVDKWFKVLIDELQTLLKQDSSSLLDFSILLMTMEEWTRSLELFKDIEVPWGHDMRGEIYFRTNRFLELVEWCNRQEEINFEDVDRLVAIHYLRAQALFALGEQTQALDILKEIQSLRPNYRSIDSLIFHWTQGQKS